MYKLKIKRIAIMLTMFLIATFTTTVVYATTADIVFTGGKAYTGFSRPRPSRK